MNSGSRRGDPALFESLCVGGIPSFAAREKTEEGPRRTGCLPRDRRWKGQRISRLPESVLTAPQVDR